MRPLDGVKVVEAASYVTGPFAALALADLGASVVKVEPPRGDPMRRFGLRHQGDGVGFAFAAVAFLVLFPAAARTWIVSRNSHLGRAQYTRPIPANVFRHSGT